MLKSAMIRVRTEPGLKREVERILHKLGFSASEAVTIFYKHIQLYQGFPFDIRIPNAKTREAMNAVEMKRHLLKAKNADEMIQRLGS